MTTSTLPNKLSSGKNKFAVYSAMATAFLLIGNNAESEIIYTDIEDYTVDLGEIYSLDIDGAGELDALFWATVTDNDWSFVRAFGFLESYSVGGWSNAFVG